MFAWVETGENFSFYHVQTMFGMLNGKCEMLMEDGKWKSETVCIGEVKIAEKDEEMEKI